MSGRGRGAGFFSAALVFFLISAPAVAASLRCPELLSGPLTEERHALDVISAFESIRPELKKLNIEDVEQNLTAFRELARMPVRNQVWADADSIPIFDPNTNLTNASINISELTRLGGALATPDRPYADSKLLVLYHGTTIEGLGRIARDGIDFLAGDGEFGPGFYLTTSRSQAVEWAKLKGEPALLVIVIDKAAARQAAASQSSLSFPVFQRNGFFENFAGLNQRFRNLGGGENPSARIGMIYGPSVSRSGQMVDQIRLGDNSINQRLFSLGSRDIAVFGMGVK